MIELLPICEKITSVHIEICYTFDTNELYCDPSLKYVNYYFLLKYYISDLHIKVIIMWKCPFDKAVATVFYNILVILHYSTDHTIIECVEKGHYIE